MSIQSSGLAIQLEANDSASYPGSGNIWYDISGGLNINATNFGAVFQSTSPKHFLYNNNDDSMSLPPNVAYKFSSGVTKGFGVWINLNETSATHTHPILSRKAGGNGQGWEFTVINRNVIFKYKNDAIDVTIQSNNQPITLTGWHYVFIAYTPGSLSSSVRINVDGVQVAQGSANSTAQDGYNGDLIVGYDISRNPANFFPGKIGAIHFYSSNATGGLALSNYNAQQGIYNPVNISITKTPATASALFVNPTVTIGTNVSKTPATANVLFVDPTVSGSVVNASHSSIIVTAILTTPTITFSFDDNVEIWTSVLVSALFVEPSSYFGEINISNLADAMTASVDFGTHTGSIGTTVSYAAEEATASGLFVEPERFGPDDVTINATSITATALIISATTQIANNYRALVKKHLPMFYGTAQSTPNWRFIVNDGYSSFVNINNSTSTAAKDSASPFQFASIGNQHSWKVDTTVSDSNNKFKFTADSGLTDVKNAWAARTWSVEFWFTPGEKTMDTNSCPRINIGNVLAIDMRGDLATAIPNPLNPQGFPIITEKYNEIRIFLNDSVDSTINHKYYVIPKGGQTGVWYTNKPKPMDGYGLGWNHIVITAEPYSANQTTIKSYVNGFILATSTVNWVPTSLYINEIDNATGFIQFQPPYSNNSYFDEPVIYNKTLTSNDVYEHWNFVQTFEPNAYVSEDSFFADAEMGDATFFIVSNIVFPEIPVTANATFVNPVIGTSISTVASVLTASANFVNPYFYGDPDFNNLTLPMTATADALPNVYRLDTAYYSYVQSNIAPFRFVTFDNPNSNLDYGSDNDFGNAVPFLSNGTITTPILGLNNNSLLTDGASYLTDGLIMKESEHNDNWGSVDGIYHFSFWIQKSISDTNPLGLRIIANVNSYLNNEYVLLYQYGDYMYLQVNDQTNSVLTVASNETINIFDNNKKHIVLVASHPGSNGNIKVYVNGILKINANLGNVHPQFINSISHLSPNSETNNYPRFSVNCLITPLEETTLPINPTPSQVYIDDVHWALTSLNQTQVTNLTNAMPYSLNMNFNADFALALNSNLVDPDFGTGCSINANSLLCSALSIAPTLIVDFDKIVTVEKMESSALFVLPTFFADDITNISVAAQPMAAQAIFVEPALIQITFSFPTMIANANMQFQSPYLDPYNLLIYQQSVMSPVGNLYNRNIGDIDTQ